MKVRCAPVAAWRGAASLTVLLLLLMASLLVCAWAQRNVLAELRSAQAQVQATLAFEAAEAGLAWAQTRLNAGEALDTGCRAAAAGTPAGTPTADSFATRFLGTADTRGWFTPATRALAGLRLPLQAACAREGEAWVCDCPADGAPALSLTSGSLAPSFTLQFSAQPQPGLVRVDVTGCSHWAPPCRGTGTDRAEAVSRLRMSMALMPGLATAPAATLTLRGDLDLSGAAGLAHADAATGGLAVLAGGSVNTGPLRIYTSPGAAPGLAVVAGDAALAALTPDQVLGRHLGSSVAEWMLQPGVQAIDCGADCSNELLRRVATQVDIARVGVRGGLSLNGPVVMGNPDRPVLLVVDGPLLLAGPVQIHGVVLAERLQWDDLAPDGGGLVHGAVVLAGGFTGTGAPDLVHDAALVRRLQLQRGSWVRVPGSWKDF